MSGSLSTPVVSSTPVNQGFISGLSPSVMAWLGPAAQDESGGNAGATNPTSTAAGLYQFTQPTWDGLVQQYGKQYGLTPNGRTNAQQARLGAQLIAQNQYLPVLKDAGITSPSPDDIQQVHFWGASNFKKLYDANSPSTPLRQVLGQDFNEVFNANAGLFGHNPNITVGQAGAAVDAHMPAGYGSSSMLPAQLGGSYAGTGQPMSGSAPAAGGILSAYNDPQAQAMAAQTIGQQALNGGNAQPSAQSSAPPQHAPIPLSLLFARIAQGAAAGRTPLQSLGGIAAAMGDTQQEADQQAQQQAAQAQQQQEQQQQLAALAQYRQQTLNVDNQRNQIDATNGARTAYMNAVTAGLPPAQAAQISGYTPPPLPQGAPQAPQGAPPSPQSIPMSPALANATIQSASAPQAPQAPQAPGAVANPASPSTPPAFSPDGIAPQPTPLNYNMPTVQPLGRQTLGGRYTAPGGQSFLETLNQQGVPAYRDTSTGQTYDTLPPGAYPDNSPQAAAQAKDDVTSLNTDRNAATAANQQIAQGQQLLSLLPQISPGSSAQDELTRFVATHFGVGNQAAQQQASMLFNQMNTNRMHMISGYGRVDLPMVKAVLGAGAGWQDNPQAIRGIVAFTDAQAQYASGAANTWDNLSATQQSRFGGYSAFKQQWERANPETTYVTNYLKQAQSDPSYGWQKQAPQPVAAAPSNMTPRQQHLNSILFGSGDQ